MAIGLTLTYLTTKVPNFAYGSFVTIGIYSSLSLYSLYGISPYGALPLAFLLGSMSSAGMYLGILRILARRGSSLVSLMIATLAIDIGISGFLVYILTTCTPPFVSSMLQTSPSYQVTSLCLGSPG